MKMKIKRGLKGMKDDEKRMKRQQKGKKKDQRTTKN